MIITDVVKYIFVSGGSSTGCKLNSWVLGDVKCRLWL